MNIQGNFEYDWARIVVAECVHVHGHNLETNKI